MATIQLPPTRRTSDQSANAPPAQTRILGSTPQQFRANLQTPSFCLLKKTFTQAVTAAHETDLFISRGKNKQEEPR